VFKLNKIKNNSQSIDYEKQNQKNFRLENLENHDQQTQYRDIAYSRRRDCRGIYFCGLPLNFGIHFAALKSV